MDQISSKIENSYEKLLNKLGIWLDQAFLNIPNIIIAVIILIIAYLMVGIIRRTVQKITQKFTTNPMVLNLVSNLSIILYGFLTFFMILGIFNLDDTITKILATAGVLGLAVGLALQDPMKNLFSGVYLSIKNLYSTGDLIESNGYFGTIEKTDLRNTIIKKLSGEEVIIPNKYLMASPLVNYSISGKRRIEIQCGVSYGDDLEFVEKIVKSSVSHLDEIDKNKEVEIVFTEFGNSSINFNLFFWINVTSQIKFLTIKSEAIKAIKKAFDENNIAIPFPIRTLDFGIKGGVTMTESLQATNHN